ncbi:MAG: hypothetical protein ACI89L_002019 [Phycisphaerales bacterium]|jgi:hypothetical protein
MKLIWNVIAVLCFLNVVALLGIFGWLANSGRLNESRVQEVASIFTDSVEVEQAAVAKAERAEAAAVQLEMELPDRPPVTAEDQLAMRVLQSAVDRQQVQRLSREISDLQSTLQRERELLDKKRAQLEADQAEFSAMRSQIAQSEGAEQFRKALTTIESVSPKAAKDMLMELIRTGSRDEAVGYLDAMQDRSRTKVISELVKSTETALAAELLEELRVRGIGDVPPEVPAP